MGKSYQYVNMESIAYLTSLQTTSNVNKTETLTVKFDLLEGLSSDLIWHDAYHEITRSAS